MNATTEPMQDSRKSLTTAIYALYAASPLVGGVTGLVAVILNYLKRDEVRGTWLESHFRWQMQTFWISLVLGIVAFATFLIGIGIVIGIGSFVWFVYRIVKGWLALSENRPI